jgi:hypothetical protein
MADDGVRYELKTAKAMRGTEGRSIAKWQKDGWELVGQSPSTLYTTLDFRKPKPALPVRQLLIGGAAVLVLGGVIGTGALIEGNGGGKDIPAASSASASTGAAETDPMKTEEARTAPSPAIEQPAAAEPVTDVTVDELLDRLNAGSTGGIEVGDQFRLTAELFESDAWGTGVTGDYYVMLKAKGGADDLLVFVDPAAARGWVNGTRVQMVVESTEVTIDGETTDGWLRARTVTPVSGS